MKVLFIAKNIPRPTTNTNKIILTLADKLSEFCNVSFLRPREKVPFWLKNSKKFGDLYGLKGWKYKSFNIITYPYIHLPIKKGNYWLLNRLSKVGKAFIEKHSSFDIIHAHYLFPDGYIAYQIYKKYNIPYVVTFRNQDKQYLELISHKNIDYIKAVKILINASKVITTNGAYKEFVDRCFQIDAQIVPHGINSIVFKLKPQKKKNDCVIIATVAEAISRKNIDWIIKAVQQCDGINKIELHIIGEGKELNALRKLAAGNKNITFHGHLPHNQVLRIMRDSDIFALPSYNETFGMVYLEAAATKNAIIGYRKEGVWGIFEENIDMLFCNNFNQFQAQLHQLISNKDMREQLAQNAFNKAKALSWVNIIREYKEIYVKAFKFEI